MTISSFQKKIYTYYREHKRMLPWRNTTNPYRILVSEVMLQQTQSSRVIPKYKAFLEAFPNARALYESSVRDVLSLWQGLGYNRRALLLKRTAEAIITQHKGRFPKTHNELVTLPGIGPYTASALMAFAYNTPTVMIETNIRAVFIHFFFPKSKKVPDAKLLPLIEKYMDRENPREWYNALMDYGAMLKATVPNPSRKSKHHTKQSKFNGSMRQIRGAIIRLYTENPKISQSRIIASLPYKPEVIKIQYKKLKDEGFFS
jgi:A/G-specific adenine glycosylase